MPCGLPAGTFKAFGAWNAPGGCKSAGIFKIFGAWNRKYFQAIWCLECPAGCQPANTFKAFGAWNALRAANPQVLSRHLVLGMPLGAANPQVFSRYLVLGNQVLSRHLVLGMPCKLPTRRDFQGIWCLECPAGCTPAGTFKAFGAWNVLRAANPQVLSRHLVLGMPCGLPTRRDFQGIWCLECPAGCTPAGTFKAFGAWNALRAANPQVLSRHLVLVTANTFKAFGAWNALRAAKPQVLSRHLVLEKSCGLQIRRYFQGIWYLECPAGCQPADFFKAFGAWNALRTAKPQVLSRHLLLEVPCELPTRRDFQGIWCLECPAGCQLSRHLVLGMPRGLPTRRYFQGIWCLEPHVLSRHLVLGMPCGLPTRRYFQGIWCLECHAGCHNPQVLLKQSVLEMPSRLPTRRYFQGLWCLECPTTCQPAGTFKAFGAWNSRHLVLGMPCGLPTRRYFQGIWSLECPAGCQPTGTFKAFGA